MKNLKIILFLSILFCINGVSDTIDVIKQSKSLLLESSSIYIDDRNLTLGEILKNNLFKPYAKPYINIGMSSQTIWISFMLNNGTKEDIQKTLVLSSPLLEYISLYTKDSLEAPLLNGRADNSSKHNTLFYRYTIDLAAKSSTQYYLKVRSDYTPVDFGLVLQDEKKYLKEDISQQLIAVMLIGAIVALMLYNFLVSMGTRDKSYFYYSVYLFVLIWQQMSYLGLTQIYLPSVFNIIDMQIPNLKGAFLIVSSALFAMYFLKISTMPILHKIYKLFIWFTIISVLVSYLFDIRNMYFISITAILYISFTLVAGIISYLHGNKQSRLFIIGFLLLLVSYMMLALDALGITSIMQEHRSILAWTTAIDALILSLAFADRYLILQQEKIETDRLILNEYKHREEIVQEEVIKKTFQLNQALKAKEMLLQEVHHRIKNNLQIILSIVRLQNDEIEDIYITNKLTDLENRINSIAKTYTMLLGADDLENIDMKIYIESLLLDIAKSCDSTKYNIEIHTNISAIVPLRESVYVGLIINELVTNSYKYAFNAGQGTIMVGLLQDKNSYTLTIEDDGKGYVDNKKNSTLGLQLMRTLVYNQLGGEMKKYTRDGSKYTIRFSI